MNADCPRSRAAMFVLEIDYHRGGRCYYVDRVCTTTDPKRALRRRDRLVLEKLAQYPEVARLNPVVKEVAP